MLIQCSVFESSDGGITKAVDKRPVFAGAKFEGCPVMPTDVHWDYHCTIPYYVAMVQRDPILSIPFHCTMGGN